MVGGSRARLSWPASLQGEGSSPAGRIRARSDRLGWNCTPTTGQSRCSIAITTSSRRVRGDRQGSQATSLRRQRANDTGSPPVATAGRQTTCSPRAARASAPMHRCAPRTTGAAESLGDGLVPEAHAEDGIFRSAAAPLSTEQPCLSGARTRPRARKRRWPRASRPRSARRPPASLRTTCVVWPSRSKYLLWG